MDRESFEALVADLVAGDENAFFTLLDVSYDVVPLLVDSFRRETDAKARGAIIEVIWQHRQPSSVPFLAEALRDPAAQVWQESLDGLVAIGGQASRDVLEEFLSAGADDEQRKWVAEAIEQLQQGLI